MSYREHKIFGRTLMLISVLAVGCESQADSDYVGEVQATLQGTVELEPALRAPEGMDVVLAWHRDDDGRDLGVGQRVTLTGQFPAGFKLDLTEPPPPNVLLEPEGKGPGEAGPKYAIAVIMAVTKGRDVSSLDDDALGSPVGGVSDHVVAYLEDDATADSESSHALGGVTSRGFHLLRVIGDDELKDEGTLRERSQLVPVENGFDEPIEITIRADPDRIGWPDWH